LPKEKIFINAFGVIDDIKNLNFIPSDIFKALENLQRDQNFI
jgi:hypothetical protein